MRGEKNGHAVQTLAQPTTRPAPAKSAERAQTLPRAVAGQHA